MKDYRLGTSCEGPQGGSGGAGGMNTGINLGEMRFTWLLRQRSIPFCDEANLEQRIEVKGKRPDFYAEPRESSPFFAEIKELQKQGPLRRVMAAAWAPDPYQNLNRLREPVEIASKQLKPYEKLRIAMLVVFDNARQVGVSLGSIDLLQLLGMSEYRVLINATTGEKVGPAKLHSGSKQVLTPDRRRYISAIAVNLPKQGHQYMEPTETERPMRLRILHNPYASVSLPLGIFNDPEDEHIGVENGRWMDLRTKHPVFGGS